MKRLHMKNVTNWQLTFRYWHLWDLDYLQPQYDQLPDNAKKGIIPNSVQDCLTCMKLLYSNYKLLLKSTKFSYVSL